VWQPWRRGGQQRPLAGGLGLAVDWSTRAQRARSTPPFRVFSSKKGMGGAGHGDGRRGSTVAAQARICTSSFAPSPRTEVGWCGSWRMDRGPGTSRSDAIRFADGPMLESWSGPKARKAEERRRRGCAPRRAGKQRLNQPHGHRGKWTNSPRPWRGHVVLRGVNHHHGPYLDHAFIEDGPALLGGCDQGRQSVRRLARRRWFWEFFGGEFFRGGGGGPPPGGIATRCSLPAGEFIRLVLRACQGPRARSAS